MRKTVQILEEARVSGGEDRDIFKSHYPRVTKAITFMTGFLFLSYEENLFQGEAQLIRGQ